MLPVRTLVVPLLVGMSVAAPVIRPLRAQSAQPYAIQIAVFSTTIDPGTGAIGGVGVEPQFRASRLYTSERVGALSAGIGGQFSSHWRGQDNLKITGIFLEPRWVPAFSSNRVFPYISMRLAVLRVQGTFKFSPDASSSGTGYGIGGGVAIKLTRTTNLDAGAQLLRQQFGTLGPVTFGAATTYAAKVGMTLGFPR